MAIKDDVGKTMDNLTKLTPVNGIANLVVTCNLSAGVWTASWQATIHGLNSTGMAVGVDGDDLLARLTAELELARTGASAAVSELNTVLKQPVPLPIA